MEEKRFVETSRHVWERLADALADTPGGDLGRLDAEELRRVHEDYRRTAADLAYAQTHFPEGETRRYLNRLVARAHGTLYGVAPKRTRALRRFLSTGYPSLVRAHAREILLAAGLLLAASALGYLLAYARPPLARTFVPEQFLESVGEVSAEGGSGMSGAVAPLLSSGITVNNVFVSFYAFAGGMTFGAYTVWVLVRNGLLLGVLAALYAQAGLALDFWALIWPHGALELPAIAIAAGSGLILARALVSPGDLPRVEALKEAAPRAGRVILGSIPLFIVAGLIEGFFTPSAADPWLKIAVGWMVLAGLVAYLGLAGRSSDPGADAARRGPTARRAS